MQSWRGWRHTGWTVPASDRLSLPRRCGAVVFFLHDRPTPGGRFFPGEKQTMTQSEVDCAVAAATGEDLCNVRCRGFGIADPIDANFDPEPYYPPQLVDWDELELERNVAVIDQRQAPRYSRVRRARQRRTPKPR